MRLKKLSEILFKPCPFCGSTDVRIMSSDEIHPPIIYWIQCDPCDAQGSICKTREKALSDWDNLPGRKKKKK